MRRVKVINLLEAIDRWFMSEREFRRRGFEDVTRFEAVPYDEDGHGGIPATYKNLVATARSEGWGTETIVSQDDVVFLDTVPEVEGDFIVFGKRRKSGLVEPFMFAASPEIWDLLEPIWDGTEGEHIVPLSWRELVDERAVVLDVVRHWGSAVSGRKRPL